MHRKGPGRRGERKRVAESQIQGAGEIWSPCEAFATEPAEVEVDQGPLAGRRTRETQRRRTPARARATRIDR